MSLIIGDVRDVLPTLDAESVQMCVTSPPYWGLRDYGVDGQLGLEKTPEEYVANMVAVFREVRRVLKDDGTLWLNLGMSYAASGGGALKDWHANPGISKSSNRGGVPHDTRPSQSLSDAPAYGSDDKEFLCSQADDRVCSGSCDGPQDETPNHHDCTVRNDQCAEQAAQPTSQKARDNERLDCGQASPGVLPPDALASNSRALPVHAPDVFSHADAVLVSQKGRQTTSGDAQPSVDNSACTDGISQMSPPLVVHTRGKESFFSACGRSDCKGIRKCGLCWCSLAIPSLNVKPKDEVNIPHLVAMALQADGWYLRQTIVWSKANPMPEGVTDRCTKAHEYLFLLSKSARYWFDAEAIAEPHARDWSNGKSGGTLAGKGKLLKPKPGDPSYRGGHSQWERDKAPEPREAGRNKRSVWTVNSQPFSDWQQTPRWVRVEQGEVSDDSLRIVSPDCPVYGGLFDLLATVLDDAHEYDELIGILCKRGYLSLTPKDGFFPIDQIRALRIGRDSLDSFLGAYLETAIDHNSQRSRTGLFLATRLSCKPSVERLDYIERILARHGLSVLRPDKPGSNTWESGFSDNQKPQTIYCIAGKSESREFCAAQRISFRLSKESISHFATFPPKLIEPCILAGSRPGDTVLDPFFGSGTTGEVCERLGRQWQGIELNPDYGEMAKRRTAQMGLGL